MGYQGSQDLSSEEESSLSLSKRRKQSKVAIVWMEKNEVKKRDEEDEDDEEDKAERSTAFPRAPRTIQRQYLYLRISKLGHEEHLKILESSLSTSTAKVKLSRWRLAVFCEYLRSCCHRRQKSVEESKTSGSRERRSPGEPGSGKAGLVGDGPMLKGFPQRTPRKGLGRN